MSELADKLVAAGKSRSNQDIWLRAAAYAVAGEALTGTPESIRKLTGEIGFRYIYDNYTKQWAHTSGLVILTPDGRVSQYFYGIEYDPRALRYSLIAASNGKIGSLVDHVLMYCFQYDATTGKYSLAIMRVVRAAGVTTVLALVSFMVIGSRKKRFS